MDNNQAGVLCKRGCRGIGKEGCAYIAAADGVAQQADGTEETSKEIIKVVQALRNGAITDECPFWNFKPGGTEKR